MFRQYQGLKKIAWQVLNFINAHKEKYLKIKKLLYNKTSIMVSNLVYGTLP